MIDQMVKHALKLFEFGQFTQASYILQEVALEKPDHFAVHYFLSLIAFEQQELKEAKKWIKTAIQINPEHPEAHIQLGQVYYAENNIEKSLKHFQIASKAKPSEIIHHNLGLIYQSIGKINQSLEHFQEAIKSLSEQPEHPVWRHYLFVLQYSLDYTPEEIFNIYSQWGQALENKISPLKLKEKNTNSQLLKIAYVSSNFKDHAAAHFLQSYLKNINKQRFEVYVFSDTQRIDNYTLMFKKMVDHWFDTYQLNDLELAHLIKQHEIDILIDPGQGHAGQNRLVTFAYKPARVQLSNYPTSTGLTRMDYHITDHILDPPHQRSLFSEKLLYIPHSPVCYCPPEDSPAIMNPPYIKKQLITFGSFNNIAKLNKNVIYVWAQILNKISHSRLILKASAFKFEHVKKNFRQSFENYGISSNRIEFLVTHGTMREHLSLYNDIDIALDTFPYNGMTTTCEALWMGLPVITLISKNHFCRVAADFLTLINKTEWIAKTENEYVELASQLTLNTQELINIRQQLRQWMLTSPLCNQTLFIQQLEKLLYNAYRNEINA